MRHLVDIVDFDPDEIAQILELARRSPESLGAPLAGTGAALVFEKPSNRTRHSMEIAVVQLGGHPVYTRGEEVGFDTREPVEDIGRVMAGYHEVIAARVFDHAVVTRLVRAVDDAAAAGEPTATVINMLSDRSHPLQGLADALTMQEMLGDLRGRIVAYVGDWNNVARSLAEVSLLLGASVRIAAPHGYGADEAELERLAAIGDGRVEQTTRPADAVVGAHAVHTDTWVSMGQEDDTDERRRQFEGFTVDDAMMSAAATDAVFMHCLPAYRGLEVSADVIDGPRSVVIRQAHNRLHSARGALAFCCGVRP
ncbi:MAG: ornithine carbamoyltransferase [Actinomycetota bacterium]